jgi:hypothetical protein
MGLTLLNVSPYYQQILVGLIIVFAVYLDQLVKAAPPVALPLCVSLQCDPQSVVLRRSFFWFNFTRRGDYA